jgi:DNA repair photolyase
MSPAGPHKGRGATLSLAVRFDRLRREPCDDGWGTADELAEAPSPRTELLPDATRRIIATNDSPDIPFDRSINPYRGCEHGCIYCFARPSHAYLGFSPGLDFETRIMVKADAATLLRRELARPGYRPAVIALGVNTDAYQPVEGRLRITRAILEVLAETRHPVGLITKSARIVRDADLLADLARDRLVSVHVSVTTLQPDLARRMEPRASAPHRRLWAIAALARGGVPVGVNLAPVIPGLNDHEIEAVIAAAAEAGARTAGSILVRLPHEVKELFVAWLAEHYPDRAARVLSLIRQCRDGRLNDPEFGSRMRGSGPLAELLRQRFRAACRRHGLDKRDLALRTDLFRPPREDGQLSLL